MEVLTSNQEVDVEEKKVCAFMMVSASRFLQGLVVAWVIGNTIRWMKTVLTGLRMTRLSAAFGEG